MAPQMGRRTRTGGTVIKATCGWALLAAMSVAATGASAQTIACRLVTNQLQNPVFCAHNNDPTRLYVVEKPGRVRIVDLPSGAVHPAPFLDLTAVVRDFGEGGLLGMAFDPGYASNRFVYLYYMAIP